MTKKRTHIVISDELAAAIDAVVGKRGRSKFFSDVAWREVKRLRLLQALRRAAGSWKDKDHPELKHGAAAWIRKQRRQDEKRFERMMARR
jgi:hypothetical protein